MRLFVGGDASFEALLAYIAPPVTCQLLSRGTVKVNLRADSITDDVDVVMHHFAKTCFERHDKGCAQ